VIPMERHEKVPLFIGPMRDPKGTVRAPQRAALPFGYC
jgi:hypothetical protein